VCNFDVKVTRKVQSERIKYCLSRKKGRMDIKYKASRNIKIERLAEIKYKGEKIFIGNIKESKQDSMESKLERKNEDTIYGRKTGIFGIMKVLYRTRGKTKKPTCERSIMNVNRCSGT
jgi:hypothetical protein